MISLPAGVRVYLACGVTDLRKGFDGLAMLVQQQLREDPFAGHVFVFRGRRGDLIKALYWDTQGLCLFHLATLLGGRGVPDGGAARVAAGGHRLACTATAAATGAGRLTAQQAVERRS